MRKRDTKIKNEGTSKRETKIKNEREIETS